MKEQIWKRSVLLGKKFLPETGGGMSGSKQRRIVLPRSKEKSEPPFCKALRIKDKTPLVFPSNRVPNWIEYNR